jgi:hypothetical protein
MIVLMESGTLDQVVLGVFEDRDHMMAEVASAEPTAELEHFNAQEFVSVETHGYRSAIGNVSEVDLNVFYGS